MKKIVLIFFIIICFSPCVALSGTSDIQKINNISHEAAHCAGYFMIVSECLNNNPETTEMAASYEQEAVLFFTYSSALTDEELAFNRVQLSYNTMKERIYNRCERLSILNNENMKKCVDLKQAIKSQ